MASKVYTARDMRQTANVEELVGRPWVAAMLRQAADMIEREARREKKYEYAIKFDDGDIGCIHSEYPMHSCYKLVRREVGEWEEVKE